MSSQNKIQINGGDRSLEIQEAVKQAIESRQPVHIRGGNTKSFYGRAAQGQPLDVSEHSGIVDYERSELVLTARAGTPLNQIEVILSERGQMLAFEPPHFGAAATLGGTIACGLSGPRRPYTGAARDFVLGAKIINGKGELLHFGGQVMKNVAGYDVSRLMVGAMGTLGVLLEVSLKVLPAPAHEITVVIEKDDEAALTAMNDWAGQSLPITAAGYIRGHVYIRLSGTEKSVATALRKFGGEQYGPGRQFWHDLREHTHKYFQTTTPLWRISLAPGTPMLKLPGDWFVDWGGAQRWLKSDAPAEHIRTAVDEVGGHATLFRGGDRSGEVFHPLPGPLANLHRRLKNAFDPEHMLNRNRMYQEL
jgi:glycolate oxidase FAD binding subunit